MSIIVTQSRKRIDRESRSVRFSEQLTCEQTITLSQIELCTGCHKSLHHRLHCVICDECYSDHLPHCQICNLHHFQHPEMSYCSNCRQCLIYLSDTCRCGKLLIRLPSLTEPVLPDPELDPDEEEIRRITELNTQFQRSKSKKSMETTILPPIKTLLSDVDPIEMSETSGIFY